jgi:hypothetical protein
MADQTVSLKLDADASGLQAEVQASGQAMEDMASTATQAGDDVEQTVGGMSAAWEEHSGAINAAAGMMAAAGAAAEGFARSQADSNRVLERTSIATGIASDELRDMAFAMSDHTFAAEDAAVGMEMLAQKGFDTQEQFEAILPAMDDFADAVGKDFPAAINSADRLLVPFGMTLEDVGDQSDHLVRMINQTDIPLGTLERNLGRVPDELQALEFGFHDAAAGIEVFRDRGFSGQEAVREFRRAVAGSEGDMGQFLNILDLSVDGWNGYLAATEPAPGLTRDTADAMNDAATPLQNMTARLENLAFKYGDLSEALGTLSPILMGAGGVVFGLNQVAQVAPRIGRGVERITRAMGPAGLAGAGGALAAGAALAYAVSELEALNDAARADIPERLARYGQAIDGMGENATQIEVMREQLRGLAGEVGDFEGTSGGFQRGLMSWSTLIPGVNSELLEHDAQLLATQEALERLAGGLHNAEDRLEEFDAALADVGMEMTREEAMQLADSLGVDLTTAAETVIPRMVDAAQASDDLADSGRDNADAQDEAADAIDRQREALAELVDEQRAAVDPVFALERAMSRYEDVTSDAEATSWDTARAIADLERAALDGDLSFDAFERTLDRWVSMGAISREEANELRGEVAELRGEAERYSGQDYIATIGVDDQASGALRTIQGQLDRLPGSVTIPVSTRSNVNPNIPQTFEPRADGGPVWPDQWFLVGEDGPEMVQFAQPGMVHSAPDTAQLLSQASTRSGGGFTYAPTYQVPLSERDHFRDLDRVRELADARA